MPERVDENEQQANYWTKCENRPVLICKIFYLFFYTAVGALFPYLPVYFKQLGLTPHQIGVLIGIRPLIQFCVTPFWGACADKYCKSKVILLMSVTGWLLSNFALSLVPQPYETQACETGGTAITSAQHHLKEEGQLENKPRLSETVTNNLSGTSLNKDMKHWKETYVNNTMKVPRPLYGFTRIAKPWQLEIMKDEEMIFDDFPPFVGSKSDIFVFLLAVTIVGTIISAPTNMMADTATLNSLEGETHKYGKVRLWGSLGWGVGGFSVGAAISSNVKTSCDGDNFIDYMPCFYVYAVSMSVAFLFATQFRYKSTTSGNELGSSHFKECLKVLANPRYCFVMFVAFFCGSATGFIETFLFWYLHELGGGQLLLSVVNGLNCLAEVAIFFVTDHLLACLGCINIMYMGLFLYAIRFLYFYFVSNPWAVLPAELFQGITTAAFWSACVSYVGLHPVVSHTLQGILNGLYMGLGFASGGFLGGVLVHAVRLPQAFLIYAFGSVFVLLGFVIVNKTGKKDLKV